MCSITVTRFAGGSTGMLLTKAVILHLLVGKALIVDLLVLLANSCTATRLLVVVLDLFGG